MNEFIVVYVTVGSPDEGDRLARALVPELERRSLDSLMQFFGIESDARHRAAGDAVVTARALQRLLARARERGIRTWEELEGLAR